MLIALDMGDPAIVFHVVRPLLELLAMGAICGTVVLLALAPGFMTFGRTIAVGVAGVVAGWNLWVTMGWPFGLLVSGFPILPSLVGTLLVALAGALVVRLYDETLRGKQEAGDVTESHRQAS